MPSKIFLLHLKAHPQVTQQYAAFTVVSSLYLWSDVRLWIFFFFVCVCVFVCLFVASAAQVTLPLSEAKAILEAFSVSSNVLAALEYWTQSNDLAGTFIIMKIHFFPYSLDI